MFKASLPSESQREIARKAKTEQGLASAAASFGLTPHTLRKVIDGKSVALTTLSRIVERTRKADEFAPPGAPVVRAPQRRQPDTLWSLEKIREARDAQMRGDFYQAVRMAEAMRTDDALYSAYLGRIGPQNAVATKLVATGGERGEAVARKAAVSCQVPRTVLTGIAGTLANHGIAIGQIIREVKEDGARVDFRLTEWPLEFVKWNPWTEQLETIVRDGGMRVPIVHGDGEWVVFRKFEGLPWTQEAALLPASMIWGAHAYALADWAGSSRSHGLAKLFGELPAGVSLQQKLADGSIVLSDEAQAFLQMMVDVASGESLAGIRPAGSTVDVPANNSAMYQVFTELVLDRKKAAFFVYLGTDASLGAAGGAPGVDIATLFAVASTKLQGDFEAIEQALNVGFYQVWTAINCGDSRYSPRIEYQIPDPDAAAKSKEHGERFDRLWAAVKGARENGILVDQPFIDALCKRFGIEDRVTLKTVATATNAAQLTALAGTYDESKHQRADDGKFGSGTSPSDSPTPKTQSAAERKALDNPQVKHLLDVGFSGGIPQSGLRPASFEHLRNGGAVHGGIPTLKVRADGGVQIVDGRHRLTLARERGDKSFKARVLVEGKKGGVTHDIREIEIPLKPAAQAGEQRVIAAVSKVRAK